MDAGQLEKYEIAVELLEQFDTCFLDLGKLLRQAQDCQSASKIDPRSAFKIDPLFSRSAQR
jgi:hypothetical protein